MDLQEDATYALKVDRVTCVVACVVVVVLCCVEGLAVFLFLLTEKGKKEQKERNEGRQRSERGRARGVKKRED